MRVLIVTAGSMGDVAPLVGLAVRLKEAGHEVAIATHGRFAPVAQDSGVGFRLLRRDPNVLWGLAEEDDTGTPAFEPRLEARAMARNVKRAAAYTRDHALEIAAAAQAEGGADVLLLNGTVAPLAWHVAEAMDVACVGTYIELSHPTRESFPPYMTRPLGPRANRAAGHAFDAVVDLWISRAIKELRAELGLPPLRPGAMRRRMEAAGWPVCYGISPTVFPRPADWRPGVEVVGYWWPRHLTSWQPPPELVDFLDAGPPPVLVDFGSMRGADAERIDELVRSALHAAGVRGVVQSGWGGTAGADGAASDDVITVGHVDHGWLMPRTAAVVHHAGSGTTGATLRAGVPSVPVPVSLDQPFWATRLDALGVSPGRLSLRRLSADDLATALHRVVSDPLYRRNARAIARRIEAEDGAGRVVDVVARALPHQPTHDR